MWKKLARFSLKLVIGLCLLAIGLFWLFTTKGEVDSRSLSSQDVVDSHRLVSSTLQQLRFSRDGVEVTMAQEQLDALLNVASHTLQPVIFHGGMGDFGVIVHAALQLPRPFEQRLMHAYCLFSESSRGFVIDGCRLGKVPLPGWLSMALFRSSVRLVFASPSDKQLLGLFQRGRMQNGRLVFRQSGLNEIELQLNPRLYSGRQLGRELLGSTEPLASDIAVYLDALERLAVAYPQERRLAFYMQQVLILALERSEHAGQQEQAFRNALWALAVGFGNPGFIRFAHPELGREAVPSLPGARLAGRRDLTLHFLYSAVIKQVGNPYLADQIGQLKELHDAASGGTGYSFVDIAANRAGIHFAEQLARIDDHQVLTLSTEDFERAFFPEILDLPEGLSESQVQLLLGGLQGDGFKALHRVIDERVAKLPLFQAM